MVAWAVLWLLATSEERLELLSWSTVPVVDAALSEDEEEEEDAGGERPNMRRRVMTFTSGGIRIYFSGREEDDDSDPDGAACAGRAYERVFKGHFSSNTIKGVSFLGSDSSFVMSGSDNNHIYIWERDTGRLVRVLEGHEGIVNVVIDHPQQAMVCSSGIDNYVKVWKPMGRYPSAKDLRKRARRHGRLRTTNPGTCDVM
mmetsp:Transcript_38271/g.96286  ORF Transcript_38271/g.96286 Transcript_38271/m.96286 type:complete len:200 (+) Transcript_38271:169-768(+)